MFNRTLDLTSFCAAGDSKLKRSDDSEFPLGVYLGELKTKIDRKLRLTETFLRSLMMHWKEDRIHEAANIGVGEL